MTNNEVTVTISAHDYANGSEPTVFFVHCSYCCDWTTRPAWTFDRREAAESFRISHLRKHNIVPLIVTRPKITQLAQLHHGDA